MRYPLIFVLSIVFMSASCGSPAANSTATNTVSANVVNPVSLPADPGSSPGANANCTTCLTLPIAHGTPAVNDEPGEIPPPDPVIPNPEPNFYLGCWMTGDNIGISITDTTIETNKSAKPLRYRDVTDDEARSRSLHVLEILDNDDSKELKKYVALAAKPDDQMQGRGYDTLDDVHTNHPNTVYAIWAKADCKQLTPLLKRKK